MTMIFKLRATHWRRFGLLLLTGTILVGCASTKKRFEKAGEFEEEGRIVEAAEAYLEVLDRDPDFPGARDRLTTTGRAAVRALFDDAKLRDGADLPEEALGLLNQLDSIRERAARHSVELTRPIGYQATRAGILERAIEAGITRAEGAADRGDWDAALQAYDSVLSDYDLEAGRRKEIEEARIQTTLSWARAEMDVGHFRAAYERAGQIALSLDSLNSPLEYEAREVMAVALDRGMRLVAVLPFWQTDAWQESAPPRFIDDLNDTVAFDYPETGSPFIQLAGTGEIRRTLRLNRLDERRLDRRQATNAGRLLEVDFVVAGDGIRFVRSERTRREETRSARMRGGARRDTTYVRRQFDIRLEARVQYRIVDVAGSRTARERTIETEITERYERSFFDGDWRDLDLSDRERSYFDRNEWAAEEDALALDLVSRMADELTRQLYDDILVLIE